MDLQLRFAVLSKLLPHTAAMLTPLVRQERPRDLLVRLVGSLPWPPTEWMRFCAEQRASGRSRLQRAHLPIAAARQALQVRIRQHAVDGETARKRPASSLRLRPAGVPSKRTAYTRVRLETLRRERSA